MPKSKALVEPEAMKGHVMSRFITKLTGQPDSYINRSNYEFGATLGAGSFGIVRQAKKISTDENVAVKIVLKKALKGKDVQLQMLYDELYLLQQLKHPNIVEFKGWFESKDKFYIVTQLAVGGELFERILNRGKFTELDAVKILIQLLGAIEYMHSQNVVHRDLKPENVLYISKDEDSPVVIADFGIAKKLSDKDDLIFKAAGSLGYVAPEVLTGKGHGKPCDVWSLGVITYTLLCGYSPFIAEDVDGFLQECTRNEEPVTFHSPYWNNISDEAKKFILKALTLDQNLRPTATDLLNDPWITSQGIKRNDINILPSVKKGFSLRNKLHDAIEIVMINNRIRQLKNMYMVGDGASDNEEEDADIEECSVPSLQSVTQTLKDITLQSHNKVVELTRDQIKLQSALRQDAFALIVKAATKNKHLLGMDATDSESSQEKLSK